MHCIGAALPLPLIFRLFSAYLPLVLGSFSAYFPLTFRLLSAEQSTNTRFYSIVSDSDLVVRCIAD